jgi:hypothetical protein
MCDGQLEMPGMGLRSEQQPRANAAEMIMR